MLHFYLLFSMIVSFKNLTFIYSSRLKAGILRNIKLGECAKSPRESFESLVRVQQESGRSPARVQREFGENLLNSKS